MDENSVSGTSFSANNVFESIKIRINYDWFRSEFSKRGVLTPELEKVLQDLEAEDKK